MKKILVVLVLVVSVISCFSQEEQTLFSGPFEASGYGAPLLKTGELMGHSAILAGGQGGWVINHRLVVGGKGYMLVNPQETDGLQNILTGFGCGGIFVEYMVQPQKLVHTSFEAMIGLGGVYNDIKDLAQPHDPIDYTGDACFVFEPGINVNLNVTKFFRIGAGVTYRLVNGIDYDAGEPHQSAETGNYKKITDSDLSGVSAQVVFKFGLF